MASLTLRAVTSRMVVLRKVTVHASACQSILEVVAGVTILTVQSAMPVFQRKTRFQRVIEAYASPGLRRVTILAGAAITASVHVVNVMTAVALGWRAVVGIAAMAINTLYRCVLSRQPIADRIVIKARFPPVVLAVATAAVIAERASMDVIFGVAPGAG